MRKPITLFVALSAMISSSISQASITDVTAQGSGQISYPMYTFNPAQNLLVLPFHQYGEGQVAGAISTDTAADPTLSILNAINNDTGFSWTGYQVDVYMNQVFTISAPKVFNSGWVSSITQQPVWNGSTYMGHIDYTGGVPVPDGQLLVFGYDITFEGATQFNFGQQLAPVPEPGTLGFLALGSLALGGFAVARRRLNLV